MVFQASGKKTANNNIGADFKDLQLIKEAEEKSSKNIQAAKKRAEKIIVDAEQEVITYQRKAIEQLASRIEKEYQLEEKRAVLRAKKIKEEGELEAEQLTQKVQARKPKAVEHIVKAVMVSSQ